MKLSIKNRRRTGGILVGSAVVTMAIAVIDKVLFWKESCTNKVWIQLGFIVALDVAAIAMAVYGFYLLFPYIKKELKGRKR